MTLHFISTPLLRVKPSGELWAVADPEPFARLTLTPTPNPNPNPNPNPTPNPSQASYMLSHGAELIVTAEDAFNPSLDPDYPQSVFPLPGPVRVRVRLGLGLG